MSSPPYGFGPKGPPSAATPHGRTLNSCIWSQKSSTDTGAWWVPGFWYPFESLRPGHHCLHARCMHWRWRTIRGGGFVDAGSISCCVAVFRVAISHRSCTQCGVSPGPCPMYGAVKQYSRFSIYFTTSCATPALRLRVLWFWIVASS